MLGLDENNIRLDTWMHPRYILDARVEPVCIQPSMNISVNITYLHGNVAVTQ